MSPSPAGPAAPAAVPKPKKSVALSGTPAGNTALCTVGRTGNDLHYRGYDILEFADAAEFEEIAYLLVHEKLPNAAELAAYKTKLRSLRGLPENLKAALGSMQTREELYDFLGYHDYERKLDELFAKDKK